MHVSFIVFKTNQKESKLKTGGIENEKENKKFKLTLETPTIWAENHYKINKIIPTLLHDIIDAKKF